MHGFVFASSALNRFASSAIRSAGADAEVRYLRTAFKYHYQLQFYRKV